MTVYFDRDDKRTVPVPINVLDRLLVNLQHVRGDKCEACDLDSAVLDIIEANVRPKRKRRNNRNRKKK